MTRPWTELLPPTRGRLPGGAPITRTDPGGSFDARILILGLYPAARVELRTVASRRMNLPVQVERTSFEPDVSASSTDLDSGYLEPLGLTHDDVLLVDVMPNYLANTRGSKGERMWDNIQEWERLTGQSTGIEPRPTQAQIVRLASDLPGNVDRLTDYFTRCGPELVLTLGVEAAAVVRDEKFGTTNGTKNETFYGAPVKLQVFGADVDVVHLVHPGLLMLESQSTEAWRERHQAWLNGAGQRLVQPLKGLPSSPTTSR